MPAARPMPGPTAKGSPRDIAAGAVFLAVAAAFLWFAQAHDIGTPNRMGPAFFPSVLAVLLLILGAFILVRGLRTPGEPVGSWPWRAMALVLGAGLLFGLAIRPLGLIVTLPAVVLLSAFASRQVTALAAVVSALVLTVFCIGVFAYGLRLPIAVFGRLLGG